VSDSLIAANLTRITGSALGARLPTIFNHSRFRQSRRSIVSGQIVPFGEWPVLTGWIETERSRRKTPKLNILTMSARGNFK
jgi:hypothetical protein